MSNKELYRTKAIEALKEATDLLKEAYKLLKVGKDKEAAEVQVKARAKQRELMQRSRKASHAAEKL